MFFTVIVPTYNGERHLGECLDSVAAQTCQDFELIVVDDGSIDGSGAIADAFAATHGNVRVLHNPNEGPLLARRRGLRSAQGQYVVFLDSDDALAPQTLERLAETIRQTNADIVSYRFSLEARLGTADDFAQLDAGLYKGNRYNEVKKAALSGRFNNLWGKAFRLSCIDLDKDYAAYARLMLGEDLLQLLPIVDRSSSLARIDDVLYYYRPHDEDAPALYRPSALGDSSRVAAAVLEWGECWDMRPDGLSGALELYCNLARALAESVPHMEEGDAEMELSDVREAMLGLAPDVREAISAKRADRRLVLQAVMGGNLRSLRLATKAIAAGRRILGRAI